MRKQYEKSWIYLSQSLAWIALFSLILVSFGARSVSFHQWVHGELSHCVLIHDAPTSEPGEHEHEGQSDGSESEGDSLAPFCLVGFAPEAIFSTIVVLPTEGRDLQLPPERRLREEFLLWVGYPRPPPAAV